MNRWISSLHPPTTKISTLFFRLHHSKHSPLFGSNEFLFVLLLTRQLYTQFKPFYTQITNCVQIYEMKRLSTHSVLTLTQRLW